MKVRFILAGILCAGGLFAAEGEAPPAAQNMFSLWSHEASAPTFPSPSYFRKLYSTPSLRVELQPPAKLEDYEIGGKLVLSLRDYLDLVMANNTDIAIQKLTVDTARNNLLGSYSRFDPSLSANLSHQRQTSTGTQRTDAVTLYKSLNQSANFNYSQVLPSGTTLGVSMGLTKRADNSANTTINPNLGASMGVNLSQPLLRGRSLDIVRLNITTARARLKSSELGLTDQLTSLVQQAESAYWDVINARENLRVQEEALALQAESLKRAQRQLELGALPQLEIYRPQAQYENARIAVSQAQYDLQRYEDSLRRQIGADLVTRFRTMPIELTEPVQPPEVTEEMDREALVQLAISKRPDLQRNRVTLDIDDLNIKQSTNQLRPDVTLTASYSASGTSGTVYPLFGGGTPISVGGFSDALRTVFARDNPTYQFGLRMTLPLRDRAGNANLANNLIQKKSDTLALRRAEQQVRQDVLNAITNLESSKASVALARVARDLAQKTLEAEQKKYDLGTTELYYVLDAQNGLATAEARLSSAYISYHRNRLTLLRATGQLLDERGIKVQ